MKKLIQSSFVLFAVTSAVAHAAQSAQLYVATNGNDAWSGTLPSPNAGKTNGPLRTLQRARDVFRLNKPAGRKTIFVRGGTHFLQGPLQLLPVDSNLSIVAFKNEKPLLSGGQAITGWKKSDGNIWTAKVPTTRDASNLKLLRIGEEQQTLARYPNFDAKNPYKGGWSHVVYTGTNWGAFGSGLGGIHTPGDWIEWKINVPSDGEYSTWFYYAAENAPYGRNSMAGRTTLQVDRQEPITLEGMSDTGSWGNMQWSRVAKVQLSRGEHTLRWTNVQGGGLNFDALVLCDDPTWIPQGTQLASPTGKNLLIIQAEAFSATQAKEMIQPELSHRLPRTASSSGLATFAVTLIPKMLRFTSSRHGVGSALFYMLKMLITALALFTLKRTPMQVKNCVSAIVTM
jgi:hypothetical protein